MKDYSTVEKSHNNYIKSFYDDVIPGAFQNEYEFNRWFKTSRLRLDYTMMYRAISYHVHKIKFSTCVELGPGPGTWTKILYRCNPLAQYYLVDISKEMKTQFELEMRSSVNVEYKISDIHDVHLDKKVDLFFSSRAIEYIENPDKVCKKIFDLLVNGGTAMIVTKNPSHIRLRKKTKRKEHSTQLNSESLSAMLLTAGFTNIKVYPGIVRVPLLDRLTDFFSNRIFDVTHQVCQEEKLSKFVESYIIIASKK